MQASKGAFEGLKGPVSEKKGHTNIINNVEALEKVPER